MTAVRQGHWVVLDELNLAPSEVLEALNRCGGIPQVWGHSTGVREDGAVVVRLNAVLLMRIMFIPSPSDAHHVYPLPTPQTVG